MLEDRQTTRPARAVGVVQQVQHVTPHMRRITLCGPEIAVFLETAGVDEAGAWVKVFLPSGHGRAYSIQSLDRRAGTLTLDFALHAHDAESGPAASWAAHAAAGDVIGVAGPRSGGFALPDAVNWVLLAGDATALPAIQRIASLLPGTLNVKAYVEVLSAAERQPIVSPARCRVQWVMAQTQAGLSLCQALLHRPLPAGPGYIWIAGEAGAVLRLKRHYLQERGCPRHSVSVKGYWKAGQADHREA